MRLKKKLSAGILAVMLIVSSLQIPGGTVQATELLENVKETESGETAGMTGGNPVENKDGTDEENQSGDENDGSGASGGSQTGNEGGTGDGSQSGDETGAGGGSQTGNEGGAGDESQLGEENDGSGAGGGSQAGNEGGTNDGDQPGSEAGTDDGSQSDSETGEDDGSQAGNGTGSEDESQPGDQTVETENPSEEEGADSSLNEDDTLKDGEEDASGLPDHEESDALQVSGNDLTESEDEEFIIEGELAGVYQFGQAPSKRGGLSTYAVTDQNNGVEEYIYQQMLKRETSIDVSTYQLPRDGWGDLVSGVLNEHPDLYFVKKDYSAFHNGTYIVSISVTYDDTLDDTAFGQNTAEALSNVSESMSDLEKVIILHDYLAVTCEYDYERLNNDTLPSTSYSAYGVLVNRMAVCEGYALAYKYLLNQVGIDCYMVTSASMNHAWNMVKLDGQYYQVDVTWDDPVWDRTGGAAHTYMLRSDAAFDGHSDWNVTVGGQVVSYTATDTRYDSAFWSNCNSPIVIMQDECYYTFFDEKTYRAGIRKGRLSDITDPGTVVQDIGRWPAWDGSYFWPAAFSGLFQKDGRIYYNDNLSIYSMAPDGTDKRTEFTADTSNGYIYGSTLHQGIVRYCLRQTANIEEKETVLTADLFGSGTDPDTPEPPDDTTKGLNLENRKDEYTALDETRITSTAQGRPKMLIFYNNTCGNCRSTIYSISSKIGDFTGTDIYALEVNKGTKESVAAFQNQYGCDEIVFSYDVTGEVNGRSMAYYYYVTAEASGTIAWPLICYIDANDRFQYYTTGLTTADAVLSNLKTYCDASQGGDSGGSEDDLPQVDMTLTDGNVMMGFSGSFYTETAEKILGRLNAIRKEACQQGVRNPLTGSPLTMDDYVPLEWSADLEAIARLRAAEASVNNSHVRLNNGRFYTVTTSNRVTSTAENLAWNNDGLMTGIEQWYEEKADWVNQTGGVTGHYTSIINPEYRHVAVGAFRLSTGGWYSVAQEFSRETSMDTRKNPVKGKCIQYMEVDGSAVTELKFDKSAAVLIREGDAYKLPLNVTVTYKDYYQNAKKYSGPYLAGGRWKSSDPAVATVDSEGTVAAKAKGTTTITARSALVTADIGITVYGADESPVSVQPPAKTTYKVGQKLDISGGKVTTMSGGKPVTVSLSSGMVSGFDSSRPGISTVTVTYGGYKADFDTLIVEEPRLTAAHGQKLGDIPLPENMYGVYSWQDDVDTAQELKEVGEHTYGAEFTPKDTGKFQKLTDLRITVVTQRTLGNDIEVEFKNKTFTYNGMELEPKVVVTAGDVVLTEAQDYVLSYENNRNVGTATVLIDGQNCYNGRISRTFEIKPAKLVITAKDVTVAAEEGEKPQIPEKDSYPHEVSGLMEGDSLMTGPVFSCTQMAYDGIRDQKAPGRYEIIPSGADAGENYRISYTAGWLTVAEEAVSCAVRFDVQGHGTAPAEQIGVKVGSTIEKPADPAEAGYQFDGWYQDAACTKPWDFEMDIVQADIVLYAKWLQQSVDGSSIFAMQEISDVHYTGKVCKPAVSVYDGEVLLKSGRDYQIKYYNNINANKDGVQKQGNGAGVYFNPELPYVEIIGKGNYTDKMNGTDRDTVKVNFNILQTVIGDGGDAPASGVTLKVSDQLVTAKKAQKPFSSIKYSKAMKAGADYTLRLETVNARNQYGRSCPAGEVLENAAVPAGYEGEFLLTVEGRGNYAGSICRTIHVTDKSHLIKNAQITLGKNLKNIQFAGSAVRLTPSESNSADTFTVKCGGSVLRYRKDYLVSYRNNDRVGKAQLVITGTGEYAGEKAVTFNIKGRSFTAKTVTVKGLVDREYTGKALTQNGVRLIYGDGSGTSEELAYGTDYTISYVKNINKGTATMTFKGADRAGFSGSFKKTFKIMPYQLSEENVWKDDIFSLSSAAGDSKQAEGVQPDGRTGVGEASAVQADSMEYRLEVSYRKSGAMPVVKLIRIDRNPALPGTGEESVPATGQNKGGEIFLLNGKDYTLKYKNNKAVAKASDENPPTIIVKGKGNYGGEFEIPFSITTGDLRGSDIAIKTTAVAYNSNKAADYAYKPAVKLTDGKAVLRAGVDYEISYMKNTQADFEAYLQKYKQAEQLADDAMPRAVITAAGNYTLSEPLIVPLSIYETKLTRANLQVEVEEAVYTGTQVTPRVTVTYLGGTSPQTLSEGRDYIVSYGANVKSGKNKGSVTISGTGVLYGGSVTVKFEIMKKPIAY